MPHIFYEIKWAWQRVFRGYDDRWRWSLCDSLAKVVAENIEWLKEHHSSCPADLYDTSKPDEECHQWTEILETIKQGFDAFMEMQECSGEEYQALKKKYDKGMELFAKYFADLWD